MVRDRGRKRRVRAIMAETGLKYTAALRELERREAESAGAKPNTTKESHA